jgi:hypothetical protein
MIVAEKIFVGSAKEWVTVAVTPWMTFTPSLSYTLSADAGAHFLFVWVSDNAGNISKPKATYINYVPESDQVRAGQSKVFRQLLEAGDTISITLKTLTGDADLYLFGPGGRLGYSINPTTTVDSIVFTASQTGRYAIEVEGFEASTYSLSWTVQKGAPMSSLSAAAAVPANKSLRAESETAGVDDPTGDELFVTADTRAPSAQVGVYIPTTKLNGVE